MDIEVRKYLFDINESINSIESFLGEYHDYTIYKGNMMMRRAVEREFEIIGEAMNNLVKMIPDINISSKKQILNMRNRVIHGYDKIDDEIIWGTIVRHLPVLKLEINSLLKD